MSLCKHLLALGLLAISAFPALAAGEEERLYTVFGIAVDETAKTAAEARLIAIEKAQAEAFQRVVQKLVSEADAPRVALPEGARASDYLLGFEVVEEKNSRVRYIAKINVSFDPRKLEALFGAAGAPYASIPQAPVLLLPLAWQDGAALLWEEENLFRAAWAKADTKNRLTDFRLAKGTLDERAGVTAEQVLYGLQRERVRELAQRYGAAEVWAALASFDRDTLGNPVELEIQMAPIIGRGEKRTWTFEPAPGEDKAAVMAWAIDEILAEQDRNWKRVVLSEFGQFQDITVAVAVRSSAEWAGFLADLKTVPVVREVTPRTLALPESELALRYQGTLEQLRLALEQKGLVLYASARGYAVARKPEGEESGE